MKAKVKSPVNSQIIPTGQNKGASEEQVESCFLTEGKA
jgi:hypothetical protein